MLIGVISDTHGLLRPEAIERLKGVDLIVHGGDVGTAAVLDALYRIAPTVAVRGNVDTGAWAAALPVTTTVNADTRRIYVLHDLAALDTDPKTAGISAVVSGHSHRARATMRDGVLFLNPGAAGPRRFKLPVTLALLRVSHDTLEHEIIELITT